MNNPLNLIGFWSSLEKPEIWLNPTGITTENPRYHPELLTQYLKSGTFCDGELGYSWCRFTCGCEAKEMGSALLTDGVWGWPEGLSHYVESHSILLPEEFVKHVKYSGYITPKLDESDCINRDKSYRFWNAWCQKQKNLSSYTPKPYNPELVEESQRIISTGPNPDPLGIL